MKNEIDFLKKKIVELYQLERQMVLLVLIWVQAVISKGYQQTTKVASSKESVRLLCHVCISYIEHHFACIL